MKQQPDNASPSFAAIGSRIERLSWWHAVLALLALSACVFAYRQKQSVPHWVSVCTRPTAVKASLDGDDSGGVEYSTKLSWLVLWLAGQTVPLIHHISGRRSQPYAARLLLADAAIQHAN